MTDGPEKHTDIDDLREAAAYILSRFTREKVLQALDELEALRQRSQEGKALAAAECAAIADDYAEHLKHTSHYDGPGMGDKIGEMTCVVISSRIRQEFGL